MLRDRMLTERIACKIRDEIFGGGNMKHGRKPTTEQRKLMEHYHMNCEDWLVERDTQEELVLRHRHFEAVKRIRKRWGE